MVVEAESRLTQTGAARATSLAADRTDRTRHLVGLGVLRGIAALAVATGHMVQSFVAPVTSAVSLYFGLLAQFAVMVFFVISGYAIAHAVNRAMVLERPARTFFINRLARVFPPLVFSLLLLAVLSGLAPLVFATGTDQFVSDAGLIRNGFNVDLFNDLGSLAFLNGFITRTPNANGPLWSLPFEAWLYVVYFFLFFFLMRGRYLYVLLPLLLFAYLSYDDDTGRLFYKYSLIWFAGALAYIGMEKIINWRLATAILLFICLMLTAFFSYKFISLGGKYEIYKFNIASGFSFVLIFVLLSERSIGKGFFLSPFFKRLTDCSYTLYLIHIPIFLFIFGMMQEQISGNLSAAVAVGLASLAFSVGLAMVLSPVLENKRFFANRIDRAVDYCSASGDSGGSSLNKSRKVNNGN